MIVGKAVIAIIGRICIAAIFLLSAVTIKIPNYGQLIEAMTKAGVPAPNFLLPFAIFFLVVGSVGVILGYKTRIGALLLVLFTLAATYYFHAFWAATPEQFTGQLIHFLKNLGLVGGLLLLIAVGPGPGALDKSDQ